MPLRDSDAALAQILHQTLLGEAVDHAEEAIAVFDDDRHYLAVNDAYCSLLGHSREEIIRHKVGGTLVVDEPSRETFDTILASRSSSIGRALVKRKDGSVIAVCYRIIRTTVAGLPYLLATVWLHAGAEEMAR